MISYTTCNASACAVICYEYTTAVGLQIWQLTLRQTFPCGLPPPILHAVDPLPEGLLVYAVDSIFRTIQYTAIAAGHVSSSLIFTPGIAMVILSSVATKISSRLP
jgi:hypothetical protein